MLQSFMYVHKHVHIYIPCIILIGKIDPLRRRAAQSCEDLLRHASRRLAHNYYKGSQTSYPGCISYTYTYIYIYIHIYIHIHIYTCGICTCKYLHLPPPQSWTYVDPYVSLQGSKWAKTGPTYIDPNAFRTNAYIVYRVYINYKSKFLHVYISNDTS